MRNYRNIDADSAAVAYCDDMDAANRDYSPAQYRMIERRLAEVKSDLYEYGFTVINGEVHKVESIINDYDAEFVGEWIHNNFIFHYATMGCQAEMYKTMRGAFITKALAAFDNDLSANGGQKYFYDIVGEQ